MDDPSVIRSCIGVFKPELLSTEAINTTAQWYHLECPYCSYTRQYLIMQADGRYANYCPGCEATWKYKLERNNGKVIMPDETVTTRTSRRRDNR